MCSTKFERVSDEADQFTKSIVVGRREQMLSEQPQALSVVGRQTRGKKGVVAELLNVAAALSLVGAEKIVFNARSDELAERWKRKCWIGNREIGKIESEGREMLKIKIAESWKVVNRKIGRRLTHGRRTRHRGKAFRFA